MIHSCQDKIEETVLSWLIHDLLKIVYARQEAMLSKKTSRYKRNGNVLKLLTQFLVRLSTLFTYSVVLLLLAVIATERHLKTNQTSNWLAGSVGEWIIKTKLTVLWTFEIMLSDGLQLIWKLCSRSIADGLFSSSLPEGYNWTHMSNALK